MDLNQAGVELLQIIKSGVVEGGKVLQTQFPILCEQILRWGIVNNVGTIILSIFMLIVCGYLTMFAIKKQKANEYDGELWTFLSIPAIIVGISFIFFFWFSVFEIGKILSAPNLYILDYLKGLVTQGKS